MFTSATLCTYSAVHSHNRYVGAPGVASHMKAELAFRWEITIDDESHQRDVSVRADNASERGVSFPAEWINAMCCRDLSSHRTESYSAI